MLLLARTQGALEELYDKISKAGGEATGVPMDLTDFDAIDRLGASLLSVSASSTSWSAMPVCWGR